MKKRDRIKEFHDWYSRQGHWLFDSRQEAAAAWIQRGIQGLPMAPQDITVEQIMLCHKTERHQ